LAFNPKACAKGSDLDPVVGVPPAGGVTPVGVVADPPVGGVLPVAPVGGGVVAPLVGAVEVVFPATGLSYLDLS